MKTGTIGTSKITRSFIRASRDVEGAQVTACYSRSGDRALEFAAGCGAEPFSDYEKMLDTADIDTVYVGSPNSCHFGQAMLAVNYGKNVICEKPIAPTPREVEALFNAAEKKGVFVIEAMKSVYSEGRRIIEDTLPSLGEVGSAQLDYLQRSSRYDALLNGEIPNIFNPELCAGGLMDLGIYPIYVAAMLFGEPDQILSRCEFLPNGADISGSAILGYKGRTVAVNYSKAANAFTGSRIAGSDGALVIQSISKLSGVTLYRNDGAEQSLYLLNSDDEAMAAEIVQAERFLRGEDAGLYREAHELSLIVSRIMKEIRTQNNFPF